MDDIAIKVDHVSKTFKLPHEKQSSIKGALISKFKGGKRSYERQEVLKDISFEIKKGEFFGIVGRNGSGKSTLLKMLAGIYMPTSGSIHVNGKLTPFIELGVGFNMELTGRENVFLNGALLGFNRAEMAAMYDDIVLFAELERFMDQKLKNYSSGMQVRLAFSIAIRAKSDILLIDEVLAVGDAAFQKKCFEYFMKLKDQSTTVVLVTHDMSAVERFCDRVAVINDSELLLVATPSKAATKYEKLNTESLAMAPQEAKQSDNRWGTGLVKLKEINFLSKGKPLKNKTVVMGEDLTIRLRLASDSIKPISIVAGLSIEDSFGVNIAGPNSIGHEFNSRDRVNFNIQNLPLLPGEYKLTVAIFDKNAINEYDHWDKYYGLTVIAHEHNLYGKINLFGNWSTDD